MPETVHTKKSTAYITYKSMEFSWI